VEPAWDSTKTRSTTTSANRPVRDNPIYPAGWPTENKSILIPRNGTPKSRRAKKTVVTGRRRILGWIGLALTAPIAGCGDDDEPGPGLYAPNAQIIYRPGDDRFDYPEDVLVRVSVENTTSDRQSGTLRTTLERLDESGTDEGTQEAETPTVVDSWTREQSFSISRGTSRAFFVVFEDVLDEAVDTDTLRARATIDQ
jgi:hypothetical protein